MNQKTRYCQYCCKHKPAEGFKVWRDAKGMPRSQCGLCQTKRRMSPEEREASEVSERAARREQDSYMQSQRRKKKPNPDT